MIVGRVAIIDPETSRGQSVTYWPINVASPAVTGLSASRCNQYDGPEVVIEDPGEFECRQTRQTPA